ncbi:hypothetical protein [Thalassospira sp. MIT1370]|uniref:hypothetical protein n=1 Tax=unclassified Thalassospira TaxID=2648997 RepID=UPI00399C3665
MGRQHFKYMLPAFLGLATITGCTELKSGLVSNDGNEALQGGVLYSLPMVQYALETSFRITGCPDPSIADIPLEAGNILLAPDFEIKQTAKENITPDPDKLYILNYEDMSGPTKTSTLKVDLHENGTLKSINAGVTDRTTEVAKSAIKTGFKIVQLASGFSGVMPLDKTKSTDVGGVICTPYAEQLMIKRSSTSSKQQTETATLLVKTQALEKARAVVEASAKPSDQAVQALETALKDSLAAEKALAGTQKLLAKIDAALTIKVSDTWPKQGTETSTRTRMPAPPISKLLRDGSFTLANDGLKAQVTTTSLAELPEQLAVLTEISKVTSTGPTAGNCSDGSWDCSSDRQGVYYRVPAKAYLRSCMTSSALSTTCLSIPEEGLLLNEFLDVPQLGVLAVLPLKNGVGQDNVLAATFSDKGMLETFSYDEKTASLEKIAGVLDDAVDNALAFKELRRTAELEDLKLEKQEVEARNALQAAIAEGQPDPTGESTAQINSETELLNALLERIKAQKALEEAQAALAAQ